MISRLKTWWVVSFTAALSLPCFGQQAGQPSLSFDGLRVAVYNVNWGEARVQVVLRLENVSSQQIAVAALRGNPNDANYRRQARANISDEYNQEWYGRDIIGLSFGENGDDWTVLRPGGSVPVTFPFHSACCGHPYGPPFNFSTELKLYKFDNRQPQIVPIYFGPLGPPRPVQQMLPQPR